MGRTRGVLQLPWAVSRTEDQGAEGAGPPLLLLPSLLPDVKQGLGAAAGWRTGQLDGEEGINKQVEC